MDALMLFATAGLCAAATAGVREPGIGRRLVVEVCAVSRWELLALLGGWRLALPAMAVALIVGVNVGSHADLGNWTANAATQTQTASASSNTLAAPGF
eukprot:gene47245-64024_t